MFCRDYANALRPPVHRVALRHPVRPAHAQRPRRRRIPAARDAGRAAAHRRRRLAGTALRVRRGPRRRARARAEAGGEEPHVQPRVVRDDLDPPARGDGARSRRRRRGHVRPDPPRRLPRPHRPERPRPRRAGLGPAATPSPKACARRSPGTESSKPARERADAASVAPSPRRIAVVPAYNEEPMVAAVLEELYPLVDELVVVDDGSTDNTRAEIEQWMARGRPNCRLLVHEVNRGMSEAYLTALTELRERLAPRRARRRRPRVHRRRRRPARPARARRARRDDAAPKGSTRTSPAATSRTTARSSAPATGCCRSGRAVGPARRCTTSSRATASSGSARSRTRSTSTRGTSTARPSRSRSCSASSGTTSATTTSSPCPSPGRAPGCATPRSTSRSFPSPPGASGGATERAKRSAPTRSRTSRSRACSASSSRSRYQRSTDTLFTLGARRRWPRSGSARSSAARSRGRRSPCSARSSRWSRRG